MNLSDFGNLASIISLCIGIISLFIGFIGGFIVCKKMNKQSNTSNNLVSIGNTKQINTNKQ